MTAYYNEIDPKAAAWLRELIKGGHIADGVVDERSIEDIQPNDIRDFTQCHFFAGIGGWSYALRLAGWPDDQPVWTGSCPCQPFSNAGRKAGTADKRHLWPEFFRLIRKCRPATVFGEQVASKDGLAWLDTVSADLESADYAVGAADLCAAGVEAPHLRQRLWFVADNARGGRGEECAVSGRQHEGDRAQGRPAGSESSRATSKVGDSDDDEGLQGRNGLNNAGQRLFREASAPGELVQPGSDVGHACEPRTGRDAEPCSINGDASIMGDAAGEPSERHAREIFSAQSRVDGSVQSINGRQPIRPANASNRVVWAEAEFIQCTDGKARPIEPGTFPLAHGVPGRVGLLRGYGNAIVPQVAAEFIKAAQWALTG